MRVMRDEVGVFRTTDRPVTRNMMEGLKKYIIQYTLLFNGRMKLQTSGPKRKKERWTAGVKKRDACEKKGC